MVTCKPQTLFFPCSHHTPLLNGFAKSNHQCGPFCIISINRLLPVDRQLVMGEPAWLPPQVVPSPFLILSLLKHIQTNRDNYFTDNLHAYSRPGILVLINDADWELEGEATYALQPNDNILFVSTLHGG